MEFEVGFDAVKFHEPALGKAPIGFDSIDVGLALTQGSTFLDSHVFIVTHIDQAIVANPLIGVQHAGRIDSAANDLLERLLATIRYNLSVDFAPSFVDAKDRLLVGRSALSPRTDVAFESIGSKAGFMGFYHPA